MEKELRTLKKLLVDAHTKIRGHRGTTWPRFGIEMFLLGAIVQSNACLNRLPKKEKYIKKDPHEGVPAQSSDWPHWRGEE
jgi:hypothetical protein